MNTIFWVKTSGGWGVSNEPLNPLWVRPLYHFPLNRCDMHVYVHSLSRQTYVNKNQSAIQDNVDTIVKNIEKKKKKNMVKFSGQFLIWGFGRSENLDFKILVF